MIIKDYKNEKLIKVVLPAIFLSFISCLSAWGQDLITSGDISETGTTYTENFDGLGKQDDFAVPSHWEAYTAVAADNLTDLDVEGASTIGANGNTSNFVTNLPYNNYNTYLGVDIGGGDEDLELDRSVGCKVAGGGQEAYFAIKLTNKTGQTVSDLNVVYTLKGWRVAGDAAGANTPTASNAFFNFEYFVENTGTGSTGAITGTDFEMGDEITGEFMTSKWWDDGNVTTILEEFPSSGARAELLDGNKEAHKESKNITLTGLNWESDEIIWLRWSMIRTGGQLPVISVDDLEITIPNNSQDTEVSSYLAVCNQVNLSWTDVSTNGYSIRRSPAGENNFQEIGTTGEGVLTFTDDATNDITDFVAGTSYDYMVIPTTDGADAAESNTLTIAVPACPGDIADLDDLVVDCNVVQLTWTDVDNEDGYRVMRSTDGGAYAALADLEADVVSYSDQTVAGATNYSYQVLPLQSDIETASSNELAVTTRANDDCLGTVTAASNLATTTLECDLVELSWSDGASEDAYRVQRKLTTETEYITLGDDLAADATSYTDATVSANSSYDYKILSIKESVIEAESDELEVSTPACSSSEITTLTITSFSCDSVSLSWGDVDAEDSYQVQRRTADAEEFSAVQTLDADVTTYTDFTVFESSNYEYRIQVLASNVELGVSNTESVNTGACSDDGVLSTIDRASFSIYPNPVVNTLSIEGLSKAAKVNIYNLSGRLVRSISTTNGIINVGDIRSGIYLLEVPGEGYSKFIKD